MPLTGDHALIALLLRNLVDNALRYAPPGATVTVRLTPEMLVVEDDGPGLPPEVLSRLGDRFFRPPDRRHRAAGSACRSCGAWPNCTASRCASPIGRRRQRACASRLTRRG